MRLLNHTRMFSWLEGVRVRVRSGACGISLMHSSEIPSVPL